MLDYQGPQLASGKPVLWPPSFCQTRDLRLIYADGLSRPIIWDGLQTTPDPIGIVAPTAAPGFTASSGGGATEGTYFAGYRYYDSVHDVYSSLSPLAEVGAATGDKFAYTALVASAESRVTHVEIWRSLADEGDKFYLIARVANGVTTYSSDTTSDDTLGTTWTVDQILDLQTADKQLWARRQGVPPNYMKVCVPFQDRTFWCALAIYDIGTVSIGNGSATLTGVGTAWNDAMEGRKVYLIGGDKTYTIDTVGSVTSITLSGNYSGTSLSGVRYAIMADPKEWGNTLIFSEQDEPESVPAIQNTIGVQESLPSDNDWVVGAVPHGTQLWVLKTRHVYSVSFARQVKIDAGVNLRFDRGAFNNQCADYLTDTLYLMDAQGPWAIGPGDAYVPLGPPIQDYFRNRRVDFGKRDWWFVSCSPSEKVVRFCITLAGQTGTRPKTALCYGPESDKWWTETYQEGLSGSTRIEHLGTVRTVVGGSYERLLMLGEPHGDGVSCAGNVSASGSTTLDDTVRSPFTAEMVGYDIVIVHGTGAGQTRTISALTSTSRITLDEAWETAPNTTSRYLINYAIRGTATAATANTLSDSTKTFPANLAGASVAIIAGTGIDQINYIVSVSGHQLTLRDTWTTNPAAGSTYLVGAIECTYRSGIMDLPVADKDKNDGERAVELVYEPSSGQQHIDWRLLWDHLLTGDENWIDFTKAGLATTKGSVNKRIDISNTRSALASSPGIERIPFRARASNKIISHRFLSSELHWFQADRGVQLYSLENE